MRNKRFTIGSEKTTLGRSSQADIPIEDDIVSRIHSSILYVNFNQENEIPDCRLFDEKSTNGTYVNGKKVEAEGTWLSDRDRIKMGHTVFGFFIRDEEELSLDGQLEVDATREDLHLTYTESLFFSAVGKEFDQSVRSKKSLSVILFRIDQRDDLVERFGKLCGESLLREVAKTLYENRRPQDTALRYEEDKILILAPGTDTTSASRMVEGYKKKVSQEKIEIEDQTLSLSLTAGVVDTNSPGVETSEALIRCAVTALNRATNQKQSGG